MLFTSTLLSCCYTLDMYLLRLLSRIGSELASMLKEPLVGASRAISMLHEHELLGIVFQLPLGVAIGGWDDAKMGMDVRDDRLWDMRRCCSASVTTILAAQLSVEEQRILLLSTMLHPLSGCYTTNKKSRQESLPYSIARDATTFRIKDAVDVQVVLEAAAGLRAMVDTVLELGRDGDRLQSEEQQRYRRLRRDMGLMLLKAKSSWRPALCTAAKFKKYRRNNTAR